MNDKLTIEQSGLKPDLLNANEGTQRGRGLLEKSLRKLGAGRSIVADKNGNVIAGNKTLEGAAEIGLPVRIVETDGHELVVVKRTDLDLYSETDKRGRTLAYADNKISEIDLAWKQEQIEADFAPLDLGGWGFESLEPEEPQDAEPQIDRAAELNEKWLVKTGDLFRIGEHRLLCGDSTKREDVERVMGGEKCGACVTDPPYGQNQIDVPGDDPEDNLNLLIGVCENMPIDNGIVIAFQSPRTFPNWMQATNRYKFLRALWLYKEAQMANPWRGWILKSEMILISEIGKGEWIDVHPFAHDCYKLSEVSFRTEKIASVRPHGSVKPLSVVSDLVSRVGGDIYEPFAGSGTTLVACQNLSRKCRAIEISPNYCAVILQRMTDAFPSIEIERIQ